MIIQSEGCNRTPGEAIVVLGAIIAAPLSIAIIVGRVRKYINCNQ